MEDDARKALAKIAVVIAGASALVGMGIGVNPHADERRIEWLRQQRERQNQADDAERSSPIIAAAQAKRARKAAKLRALSGDHP
jgi:hypothetical protein